MLWFPLQVAIVAALLGARWFLARRVGSTELKSRLHSARETLDSLALTLFVVFFLVQPFVAQAYFIPTGSMEKTLPVGTRILTSPLAPRALPVRPGEVLVFRAPPLALALSSGTQGDVWIKRCIGAPGERVEFKKNVLWRNGKIVAEPYALWSSPGLRPLVYDLKIVGGAVYCREYDALGTPGLWTQGGVVASNQTAIARSTSGVVPPGKVLMLGDHRNDSLDGHVWGFLASDRIVGRAFLAFWPPSQVGVINH